MNKKVYWWVFAFCICCILLKFALWLTLGHKNGAAHKDAAQIAKEWSLSQGKLVVLTILGTTTYSAENDAPLKEKARVAYVHDGSADIVVDLTKAEFKFTEESGVTNLNVVLPAPKLDDSTVGIDPRHMHRVHSVKSSRWRSDKVENDLDTKCRTNIIKKQLALFSSIDLQEEAKVQARIVLCNLYRQVLEDAVNVKVEFQGTEGATSYHGDVDAVKTDANEGSVQ